MSGGTHPRVLLAGGGSGGSATPVLAVAQALRRLRPGTRFLYVGTHGGPEEALALAQGLPYRGISTGKLRRYWDRRNLEDPFRVLAGLWQSYAIARSFRPWLAFAAGGYAAVPPIVAARLAGARVVVHQQDVLPGLANRLLVPFAQRFTVSLPSSLQHFPPGRTTVAGNPVRTEVLQADPARAIVPLGLDPTRPIVVATGGGTGALGLNRLVAAAAPRLLEHCQVVHLTGRGRSVPAAAISPSYRQIQFLVQEMPHLLAAATLVVSRAGMGTLAELAALARPTILIPMPASHQWANARAFQAQGAAEVLDQDALTPDTLADHVLALLGDAPRRERLGRALADSMPRDAATRIAEALLAAASR